MGSLVQLLVIPITIDHLVRGKCVSDFNPLAYLVRACNIIIFETHIKGRYLQHFLWNCSHVRPRSPPWWSVDSGSIRQQAIAWAIVDPDLYHHMASLGHNDLKVVPTIKLPITFMNKSLKMRLGERHGTPLMMLTLFQIMAWCQQTSRPYMGQCWLTCRHVASLGNKMLNICISYHSLLPRTQQTMLLGSSQRHILPGCRYIPIIGILWIDHEDWNRILIHFVL